MKNLIIPALALSLAFSASAAGPVLQGPKLAAPTEKAGKKAPAKTRTFVASKKGGPARTQGWAGNGAEDILKYGQLELVLEEDFSLLSDGSFESPATNKDLTIPYDSPEYQYPWWNFDPKYTHTPHWGTGAEDGSYACPAGGSLYLEMNTDDSGMHLFQAHLNTPPCDLSGNDGMAVLEFKARTKNAGETYDYLHIEAAETNNMGPSWNDIDETVMVTDIPAEWTTYRILFREAGKTSIFNMVGVGPGNVYIDDVKIYTLKQTLKMPQTAAHSDYQGTSFVANWGAVEGAEKYLLTLYWMEQVSGDGYMTPIVYERHDVFADREVSTNKYTVTDVESGRPYYYTVKAVKGDLVSFESYPRLVNDLVTPKMNKAEILDGFTYTANWDEVPGAGVYNYWAYHKLVAAEDGPMVLTNEDFNGVLMADGYSSGATMEDMADAYPYVEYYSRETRQQGWVGLSGLPCDDYLAFDAFYYYRDGDMVGYQSPEFDLSKDGGKFTLTCDLAGARGQVWYEDGTSAYVNTQASVALFNWNDATGDWEWAEQFNTGDMNKVTDKWQTYTFNFTKGTARSMVGVYAVGSYDWLFLDNLKLVQNFKKGESFMSPFLFHHWHGAQEGENMTSIDVDIPVHAELCDIYHKVSAYGHSMDSQGGAYDVRESPYTELEYVMTSESGVESVVVADENAPVEYFNLQGIRVAQPENGIFLMRQGGTTTKVVK